jgi:hypothetical protein
VHVHEFTVFICCGRGATLVISAVGVLHDVITAGAKVDVTVKYGLITLLRESVDLCDNAKEVDLECPVDQGKLVLNKSVDIPKQIPPVCSPASAPLLLYSGKWPSLLLSLTPLQGTYNVFANAYTVDGRPITCLTATIQFYM